MKADANPGVDNVAYVTPKPARHRRPSAATSYAASGTGPCSTTARSSPRTAFQAWAAGVQAQEQAIGVLAALPPYALVYDPTVIPQLGKGDVRSPASPARAGYYYGPGNPVTP